MIISSLTFCNHGQPPSSASTMQFPIQNSELETPIINSTLKNFPSLLSPFFSVSFLPLNNFSFHNTFILVIFQIRRNLSPVKKSETRPRLGISGKEDALSLFVKRNESPLLSFHFFLIKRKIKTKKDEINLKKKLGGSSEFAVFFC